MSGNLVFPLLPSKQTVSAILKFINWSCSNSRWMACGWNMIEVAILRVCCLWARRLSITSTRSTFVYAEPSTSILLSCVTESYLNCTGSGSWGRTWDNHSAAPSKNIKQYKFDVRVAYKTFSKQIISPLIHLEISPHPWKSQSCVKFFRKTIVIPQITSGLSQFCQV